MRETPFEKYSAEENSLAMKILNLIASEHPDGVNHKQIENALQCALSWAENCAIDFRNQP